jgi:hypothetical protein
MGESRIENILEATIESEAYTEQPQSRIEALLIELKAVIEGGGSGGTSDYTDLENKPQINGHELNGNKTGEDLELLSEHGGYTIINGIRVYISATEPTGTIPDGSIWLGGVI